MNVISSHTCLSFLLCIIVGLSAILSDDLSDEYFICYYVRCLPKHVMETDNAGIKNKKAK